MNSSWYPNTDLSAGTLALIAIVAVGTLAAWLIAVFLAAREPRGQARAAASPPAGAQTAGADAAGAGAAARQRTAADSRAA